MKSQIATASIPLLLLAGCGSPSPASTQAAQAESAASQTVATASPSPAPVTPTPTPEYATPQQFASIIAMKESDWREVIDGALDCRMNWSEESTTTDTRIKILATTCHMREATITMTAEKASKDLAALTPDPSMESLVEKTSYALAQVIGADVYGQCGTGESLGSACDDAHASALLAYSTLEEVLDGWGPYL